MQIIVDYGAMIVTGLIALFRFRIILKSRWETRAVKTGLLALFLFIFSTFQVDDIYIAVDRITGVNNLSWLFSYLSMMMSAYFICFVFCNQLPGWSHPYLLIVAVLLVLVFPFGPNRAPETVDHITPANAGEILFMSIPYLHIVTMLIAVPIPACIRAWREGEQRVYDRMRTIPVTLMLIVVVLNAIIKFVIYSIGFIFSTLPPFILHLITDASRLLAGVLVALLPLTFAPNSLYQMLVRPATFLQRVRACRELGALQTRLDRVCPQVHQDKITWLDQVRDPDLCILHHTMSILDRKKMLAALLEKDQASSNGSDLSTEAVTVLYEGIRDIPASSDIDHIITVCRGLGRQILRGDYV